MPLYGSPVARSGRPPRPGRHGFTQGRTPDPSLAMMALVMMSAGDGLSVVIATVVLLILVEANPRERPPLWELVAGHKKRGDTSAKVPPPVASKRASRCQAARLISF